MSLTDLCSSKEAALAYAAQGWPVLPLKGKRPATRKGVYGATTDPADLSKRLTKPANIGIQTGEASGLVAIDVDPRNGGDETLANLIREYGELPDTLTSETGGGGSHILFQHPGGKLRGKLGDGIDVKSDGGYIVAPPSIHPNTNKPYRWRSDAAIAPLPPWLADLLTRPSPAPSTAAGDRIKEGERNETLFSLAGQLKRKGIPRSKIETQLLEENACRCDPPLPTEEVLRIAQSAAAMPDGRSVKTRWQDEVTRCKDFTPSERLVLIRLSIHMDADGRNCFPTQETVAEEIGVKRERVGKVTEKAALLGWLRRYERPKPKHRAGTHQWSYGYIATFPDDPI